MKVYIPLNELGILELEKCQEEETSNLKIVTFTPDEYFYLESKKYLDFLNVECDCIIDLYEDEDIPNDKLIKALEITQILIKNSNDEKFIHLANKFVEIFNLAIQSNTYVNIYCYGDPNRYEG